eukprot:CAMPEP_0167785124 /NCGR_PEP_ID=MMETSP0111_2-20121227/8066_1 /TAXON_ID=91324 /ORGANISM="Lotharella globosa, Strain CCCM811" /LENGTH=469 /DNA_ID=CAMNT_0007676367 /DNA_START=59 /DNA_END=1468 /DNA_ORIENTATION=+
MEDETLSPTESPACPSASPASAPTTSPTLEPTASPSSAAPSSAPSTTRSTSPTPSTGVCTPPEANNKLSKNPCHNSKQYDNSSTCKIVNVPSNMCSRCKFRYDSYIGMKEMEYSTVCSLDEHNTTCLEGGLTCPEYHDRLQNVIAASSSNSVLAAKQIKNLGKFRKCNNMYDIFEPTCLAAIGEYVQLNPCDTQRAEYYDIITNPDSNEDSCESARDGIDFLIYALCEASCDCISPFEIKRNQAFEFDIGRGNCMAHPRADICVIHNDLHLLGSSEHPAVEPAEGFEGPSMCELLDDFFTTNINKQGRFGNSFASKYYPIMNTTHNELYQLLEDMLDAIGGTGSTAFWDECFAFECSQNRLSPPTVCVNTQTGASKPCMTLSPTWSPSSATSTTPSTSPTSEPSSTSPSRAPSSAPTESPTMEDETLSPTESPACPSASPASAPTTSPTLEPTASPSSAAPSSAPSTTS